MTHDPLCDPVNEFRDRCDCELISRVRTDEREAITRQLAILACYGDDDHDLCVVSYDEMLEVVSEQ